MSRFQLLVHEPGKEPRRVPIDNPMIVGRSHSVDLTVEDQEISRKQFRISVTSGFVVLEGLGATNPTRVDESVIKSGEKTTLPPGARIFIGNTVFVLESVGNPEDASSTPTPPEAAEQTIIGRPGQIGLPGAPPAAGNTGATPPADAPMNTMEFRTPGRPGAKPPGAQPPATPPADDAPMNTMEFRTPGRPGAKPPGAQPPATPTADDAPMNTMEFRPPGPAPTPKTPQAATPKPSSPQAAPPKPSPPKAAPLTSPAAPAGSSNKPQTVAVQPGSLAPAATLGDESLDSLVHQAASQVFVKGDGLKRSIRLRKAISKIGRDEAADVPLPHEAVSEQHAELHFDGTNWTLLDSGSTNGCIVDGQHLRSTAQIVRRNSLISIGSLHLVFLCSRKKTASQDQRDELRALQLLTNSGKLDKTSAHEIRQMMRADSSQSIAEIILRDTRLTPVDWTNAVATARRKVSFFARIMRLFTGRK